MVRDSSPPFSGTQPIVARRRRVIHFEAMILDRRGADPLTVLVVEPRDFVAARLTRQLERLGHRVLGLARNGREAIAAVQSLRPDLILMETSLPGLDAISTARAIIAEQPVPVILLTGYAGAELVRLARDAGVVAYLTSMDEREISSAIRVARERIVESRILERDGGDPGEVPVTRRLVDRAKKVLITRLGLSEAEAFRDLLAHKLSTRRSLRHTAWMIIEVERLLATVDLAGALDLTFQVARQDLKPRRPPEHESSPAPSS